MADKQVQGQQAKATTIENNASNGGNTAVELEFRPNNGVIFLILKIFKKISKISKKIFFHRQILLEIVI